MYLQSFVCAVVLLSGSLDAWAPNLCPQRTSATEPEQEFFYPDPEDCRFYYQCGNGRPYHVMCPPGTVYNNELRTCDHEGYYKSCKRGYNTKPECSTGEALAPHQKFCNRYYNCTSTEQGYHSRLAGHERECTYPQLFDAVELACKPFSQVFCLGQRVETMNPCDYDENQCGTGHCEPCPSRLPSCVGLADGEYPHPTKEGSPYFITCYFQRLIQIKSCSNETQVSSEGQNSVQRVCRTTWEVKM